jgi:hypothetical protein
MPDVIPDTSPMPYVLGTHTSGTFAYFGNGAIRRLSNTEIVFLGTESKVRKVSLDAAAASHAAAVSKALFAV